MAVLEKLLCTSEKEVGIGFFMTLSFGIREQIIIIRLLMRKKSINTPRSS